ncbi:spore wall protein 1-like [Neltuma alba]|uniref:spore wall protein 1-like n=1 Tax=Neltuma alba TaxID=207710 RepID=UPI0010A2FDCA|nr:spore wall protein 1-like [Prosopis alba]
MEEQKQSTIRSTTDASEGSTEAHNMKSTTTNDGTQQTTNVSETKASHHHKFGADAKKSRGSPGGVVGTHDHPLEYDSASSGQPTDGHENKQAGSTGAHNNMKPATASDSSQAKKETDKTEAQKDGAKPGGSESGSDGSGSAGTDGGSGGTHDYPLQGVASSTKTEETHANPNQTTTCKSSQSTEQSETQVSSHLLTRDGHHPGGTYGGNTGTHGL